jgi:hypothetical protein
MAQLDAALPPEKVAGPRYNPKQIRTGRLIELAAKTRA